MHTFSPHDPFSLPAYLDDRLRTLPEFPRPDCLIYIDTISQRLLHVTHGRVGATYAVSTAAAGFGNRFGSLRTPRGLHAVSERIGAGAPAGRIFRDRIDTGTDWHAALDDTNLILTRIIRLRGLEPGINRGPDIDSWERYIYIHGTNHEERIGTPFSHGCICMRNDDIIRLFDQIREGDLVAID